MNEYLYILSNHSLKNNLLKIGFTTKTPESRAKSLSQSTSIPSEFKIEFQAKVTNAELLETRVHLLLEEYRINKRKEFFEIDLDAAIDALNKVIYYSNNHESLSNTYSLHKELFNSNFNGIFNTRIEMMLIRSIMTATVGNTSFNHIFHFENNISNGFLSNSQLSSLLSIKEQTANKYLNKFHKKFSNIEIKLFSTTSKIKVFDDLRYNKGQLSWVFSKAFSSLFYNEKFSD